MGKARRGTDVYLSAVVSWRRDERHELAALHWCTERLDGLAKFGAAVAEGEVGEVAMLAQLPMAAYQGMARWRWAVASLLAPVPADDEAVGRIARRVHSAPSITVRCLVAEDFDLAWNGEIVVPGGHLRFALDPQAA